MTLKAVDCQGFAGGFTLGVVRAGFKLVAKREMTGGFGVPNCEANRHLLGDAWRTQVSEPHAWERVDADLVFGNPPCSGFSVMSPSAFRGVGSKVNACMWAFSNYVAAVRPRVAVMESVRSAYSTGHELMTALRANVEGLTGTRYGLYHVYQNAVDLGGAAKRPRYFMVMSRVPFGVEYPRLRQLATVRDVLGDLDNLAETWEPQPYRQPATWWSASARSASGAVDGHVSRANSTRVRKGLELLEASGGWPAGVAIGAMAKRYYEANGTLPPSWQATMAKLVERDFNMGFPTTTMLRWYADQPARVVTGDVMEQVIHPWLPRMVTHREAARVMGFPDDWHLRELRNQTGLGATHGKGITVQCGEWVAGWVKRSLAGEPGDVMGVPVGEREWFIDDPRHATVRQARTSQQVVDEIVSLATEEVE